MNEPASLPDLAEVSRPDATAFAEIRKAGRPVVIRGLVREWPAVAAGLQGGEAAVDYLRRFTPSRPVKAIAAAPSEKGRFFYTPDLTHLNFISGSGQLGQFLSDLLEAARDPDPPALAVQSEPVAEILPGFAEANRLGLLPGVGARIWIGNAIRVAPHLDVKENIACCMAGRRTFTLFPPEQIGNLYPGPFELTPAGTPVSMVDPDNADLERFPRFADAWASARRTTLEPGDAIYIPYCWWHAVRSHDPVSILVNYWWYDALPGIGAPYDALLHAIWAWRGLPPAQRAVWRSMLDHYVFEANGDPGSHLPEPVRGVLGRPEPGLFARIREILRSTLR